MTRVADLLPGNVVRDLIVGESAVFVARTEHPLWPQLQLVIWRMEDGSWSHDALDARQEVGTVEPFTEESRRYRLKLALLGGK